MLFDVRVLRLGEWEVVCIVGDLDLAAMPMVRQVFDRLELPNVAIDLSGVDYLDPVTLGVVLLGALRAERSGGRFLVVSPPGRPRDLLAETAVDRIVNVVEDRDALESSR